MANPTSCKEKLTRQSENVEPTMAFTMPPRSYKSGPVSFLDLPADIRLKIYRFAGAMSSDPISLNTYDKFDTFDTLAPRHYTTWNSTVRHWCRHESDLPALGFKVERSEEEKEISYAANITNQPERAELAIRNHLKDCPCDADKLNEFPLQLLRVCRLISEEFHELFYSENKFFISCLKPGFLTCFGRLAPRSIATMTSLHVTTNHLFSCQDICLHWICYSYGEVLDSSVHHSNPAMTKCGCCWQERIVDASWLGFLRLLSRNTVPNRLGLHVEFFTRSNTSDYDQRIYDSMLSSSLPALKHCQFTANGCDLKTAVSLLENVSNTLVGGPQKLTSFSLFTPLPEEIQDRILFFTDLVAPFPISWRRGGWHCWAPSDNMSGIHRSMWDRYFDPYSGLTYENGLYFWLPPQNIFLVDRSIRQRALRIFFTENVFTFGVSRNNPVGKLLRKYSRTPGASSIPIKFELSLLKAMFCYIRHIQLYCHRSKGYLRFRQKAWVRFFSQLEQSRRGKRNMSLTLYFDYGISLFESHHRIRINAPSMFDHYRNRYRDCIAPLARLPIANALKEFYVGIRLCPDVGGSGNPEYKQFGNSLEVEFERPLMGPTYDTTTSPNKELVFSVLLRRSYELFE